MDDDIGAAERCLDRPLDGGAALDRGEIGDDETGRPATNPVGRGRS